MVLFISLLTLLMSLVNAGGPASDAVKNKRSSSLTGKFFAITTYPNPSDGQHFCLANLGASMAGLDKCDKPFFGLMYLFTIEPAPGRTVGEGYYTLRSYYDKLCVNFTESIDPFRLSMANCSAPGAVIPWFFQWNTTDKDPGTDLFANPQHTVLSSPYSKFKDASKICKNKCYYSNGQGGISTKKCRNTQEMTWFGYVTERVPPAGALDETKKATPCNRLYNNLALDTYACGSIRGGYSIRAPMNPNGKLTYTTQLKRYINGITGRGVYNRSISVKIKPHSIMSNRSDIASLAFPDPASDDVELLNRLGLAAGSTKVHFFNKYFNANLISAESLPLGQVTRVTVVELWTRVSPLSIMFNLEIRIKMNGTVKDTKTFGPMPDRILPDDLYFSAPPM